MESVCASFVMMSAVVATTMASPQNPPPAATGTDIYHVMFTKAAPGQAAELAKVLTVPDKTSPMPDHFVVLRHQEGDDWDYAMIQHLGAKAEVVGTPPAQTPVRAFTAWHHDTFRSAAPAWQGARSGNRNHVANHAFRTLDSNRQSRAHRMKLGRAVPSDLK